jgi:hypothetical protein
MNVDILQVSVRVDLHPGQLIDKLPLLTIGILSIAVE